MLLISVAASAQTIQANGVVNAAGSGHSTIVAPGSLISIFGSGLAGGLSTANSIPISTTLGDVDSPRDLLSWDVMLSLALLGVVPLLVRKLLQWYGRAKETPP